MWRHRAGQGEFVGTGRRWKGFCLLGISLGKTPTLLSHKEIPIPVKWGWWSLLSSLIPERVNGAVQRHGGGREKQKCYVLPPVSSFPRKRINISWLLLLKIKHCESERNWQPDQVGNAERCSRLSSSWNAMAWSDGRRMLQSNWQVTVQEHLAESSKCCSFCL